MQQFFYDGQIRRFIVQFIRIISDFQVEFGKDRLGNTTLQRVPVFYGDSSRQASYILKGGTENSITAVPAMAVYINGLSHDRARMQDPNFVGKMNIRQRYFNTDTQTYEQKQGNAFTIERLMPVPYTLELKVDIWTSNTEQKLQLIEQLGVLFNPSLEIQSTDNYVDWTSLSVVYLSNVNWSSRSIGSLGTENPIDIATLTFDLPIWISAPAKVKKLGIIQKIISNIHDGNGDLNSAILNDANLLGARQYFTPMDYGVLLIGNQLSILKYNEVESPREPTLDAPVKVGTPDIWSDLIGLYGTISNGISQIRLETSSGTEVVGMISHHPTDKTILLFDPDADTLPTNTINSINAIIDPKKSSAINIVEAAVAGTRLLILSHIGSFSNNLGDDPILWRGSNGEGIVASANDIIEYTGTHWVVSFDSALCNALEYVSNLNTGTQYKWNGTQWLKSWEGEYQNGKWTLVL